jgi:hypothetical protein
MFTPKKLHRYDQRRLADTTAFPIVIGRIPFVIRLNARTRVSNAFELGSPHPAFAVKDAWHWASTTWYRFHQMEICSVMLFGVALVQRVTYGFFDRTTAAYGFLCIFYKSRHRKKCA